MRTHVRSKSTSQVENGLACFKKPDSIHRGKPCVLGLFYAQNKNRRGKMAFQILLFIVGLLMLIKGGDWFVDSASGIARRFHLPELLIGATVVSIGTTLPEVMVSAQGAMAGAGAMAYGNAIGSIICNTSLIAAITIAIKPGKAERKSMIIPVTFFFAAAAFYSIMAYTTGYFYRWVGFVLLAAFVVYMMLTVLSMKKKPSVDIDKLETQNEPEEHEEEEAKPFSFVGLLVELAVVAVGGAFMIYKGSVIRWIGIAMMAVFLAYAVSAIASYMAKKSPSAMLRDIFFIIVGAGVIAGGANLLVDSGIFIAEKLGVPQTVISLTFVALGTSLPELVTAITSLAKGHGALSLGNIIGANLFNLVLVSGVSTSIAPFAVPSAATIGGINSSFVLDIPIMFAVMAILTVPTLIRGKLSRVQGISLLCLYVGFCAVQFIVCA